MITTILFLSILAFFIVLRVRVIKKAQKRVESTPVLKEKLPTTEELLKDLYSKYLQKFEEYKTIIDSDFKFRALSRKNNPKGFYFSKSLFKNGFVFCKSSLESLIEDLDKEIFWYKNAYEDYLKEEKEKLRQRLLKIDREFKLKNLNRNKRKKAVSSSCAYNYWEIKRRKFKCQML